MPSKLALGYESLNFCPKNVILGLSDCKDPGSFNRSNMVPIHLIFKCHFIFFRQRPFRACSKFQLLMYRNDPKFSDRYACANSADPDQTAPSSLIRVYTVCHSVCIVWTYYSVVEPHSSNFRVIYTTNFLGVRIFRK